VPAATAKKKSSGFDSCVPSACLAAGGNLLSCGAHVSAGFAHRLIAAAGVYVLVKGRGLFRSDLCCIGCRLLPSVVLRVTFLFESR